MNMKVSNKEKDNETQYLQIKGWLEANTQ